MKILSKQAIEYLLVGAKILGCGGGGQPEWARPMIEEVYAKNKKFRVVDPTELPPNEFAIIVGAVGGGVSEEMKKKLARLRRLEAKPELVARDALAAYLGQEPYAYLASEVGAGNSIVPLYVAALKNSAAVDADCCGRAKPEISISTTNVKNLSIVPLAIASPFGDVLILKKTVDDARAEDLCRQLAIASGGICGVARCPVRGKDLVGGVVPNSISKAIELGKAIKETRRKRHAPIEALVRVAGAYKLFKGKVKSFERRKEGAFMWGTIKFDGLEEFKGHEFKLWFKNEFLISWKNKKPFVNCPDSLYVIDAESGEGLSCWGMDFQQGREVIIAGSPAHKLWRTTRGLELFSPRHFGLDFPHVPIERIMKQTSDT